MSEAASPLVYPLLESYAQVVEVASLQVKEEANVRKDGVNHHTLGDQQNLVVAETMQTQKSSRTTLAVLLDEQR